MSRSELFGGKVCAALDRQHPRDLFDVKRLFNQEGLTAGIRLDVIAGFVGHGGPISELVDPAQDSARDPSVSFEGIPFEP